MGTAISKNLDLSTNEYLQKFVSDQVISLNDPFWNRFVAFNISPPMTRLVKSILAIYLLWKNLLEMTNLHWSRELRIYVKLCYKKIHIQAIWVL